MNMSNDRRKFRRVFSLVPEEDVVLFSVGNQTHFTGTLVDLSCGGALIYTSQPISAAVGHHYKLYLQSRGQMFYLEGRLVRKEMQLLAFRFTNVTPLDVAELRDKLARMEILAARVTAPMA
jgi:hypothetical protein